MLEHQMDLFDLDILDLCAGTGNISLEFLSREAGTVTSVDKHPVCVKFMYKLSHDLQTGDEWKIMQRDVLQYVSKTEEKFDLVFADPPYEATFYAELTKTILERGLLTEDGLAIIEHGKQTDLSNIEGYEQTRNFGNVYFSFFRNRVK